MRLPAAEPIGKKTLPALVGLAGMMLLAGCSSVSPSPVVSASPIAAPTPAASASPQVMATPTPLGREDAIAIARRAAEQYADGDVLFAEIGPYSRYTNEFAVKATPIPPPDSLVWSISLGTNPGPLRGQGESFIVDTRDGHVVEHWSWIS